MAVTNFTPLLGFALPTQGDLDGTWGTTVNDSITSLLDSAVAGTTTLSANADVTLTTTNGSSNQARSAFILWTASNGATTRNITAPAQSKAYIVINAGTGSVVIRGAGPTTGVTVPTGYKALVAWNGSDFVKVASTIISLTTDVTGTLPLANGGTNATTAADARTSLAVPGTAVANTFTAKNTFSGSTTALAELLTNASEVVTVSATAATGTINYYATTQSVVYLTSNASANWVVNLTGASTPTTLDTLLSTGQCVTLVLMVTQGSTAYYNTSVQVDGTTSGVTTKWLNSAPTSGSPSAVDSYTYTVIKTASATFTVFAAKAPFA
jgi:hypothetical protein